MATSLRDEQDVSRFLLFCGALLVFLGLELYLERAWRAPLFSKLCSAAVDGHGCFVCLGHPNKIHI